MKQRGPGRSRALFLKKMMISEKAAKIEKKATVWHFYLLRTRGGALYAGITTDVARRLAEHRGDEGRGAKFLRSKGPLDLVYHAEVGNRATALKVEAKIKRMKKQQKEEIVASNPPPDVLLKHLA